MKKTSEVNALLILLALFFPLHASPGNGNSKAISPSTATSPQRGRRATRLCPCLRRRNNAPSPHPQKKPYLSDISNPAFDPSLTPEQRHLHSRAEETDRYRDGLYQQRTLPKFLETLQTEISAKTTALEKDEDNTDAKDDLNILKNVDAYYTNELKLITGFTEKHKLDLLISRLKKIVEEYRAPIDLELYPEIFD